MNVEKWTVCEIEVSTTKEYENPYMDVEVRGVFTGPDGTSLSRTGFWDGDGSWKVRFAPTMAGEWSYKTESGDGNGDFISQGVINCTDYDGELEIYKHGFLKIMEGEKHISYNDGTPFFWLGDTHWYYALQERLEESNLEGVSSQFKALVDKRVEQKFSVYQSNLNVVSDDSTGGGYFAEGEFYTKINVDFFKNNLDPKAAYIAEQGLVHALGFAWSEAIDGRVEEMKRFAGYIIARYGAYPTVYTLAGEVADYNPMTREERIRNWGEVAKHVQAVDCYGQLQTAHYTNERPLADYYQEESWFDFTLSQMGHGDQGVETSYYDAHFAKYPEKPMVEGEAMYESLLTVEYAGRRPVDSKMVRQAAYRAMQSGCCGYTYGAQGIWNARWAEDEAGETREGEIFGRVDWRTAIDLPGAAQMTYFRDFYLSIPWSEMKPREDLLTGGSPWGIAVHIAANDLLDTVTVYIPDTSLMVFGEIGGLPDGAYKMKIFNPRTGEYIQAGSYEITEGDHIALPDAPEPYLDWMVIIQRTA